MQKQQGNWIDCRNGNLPKKDGFYYGKFVIAWQSLPPKFEEDVD